MDVFGLTTTTLLVGVRFWKGVEYKNHDQYNSFLMPPNLYLWVLPYKPTVFFGRWLLLNLLDQTLYAVNVAQGWLSEDDHYYNKKSSFYIPFSRYAGYGKGVTSGRGDLRLPVQDNGSSISVGGGGGGVFILPQEWKTPPSPTRNQTNGPLRRRPLLEPIIKQREINPDI